MYNQGGSRRWTHFHSALKLAVQQSAHKWTFEDFAECFPLYVQEDKNGSAATYNATSDYIEAANVRDLDQLFTEYDVQANVDTLHRIVSEAKDRKASGTAGKDVWKEDLEPRAAVCARTVPILEDEVKRLKETLQALEAENANLQSEIEENVRETEKADDRVITLLDKLDAVTEEWKQLPMDDIEARAVQTADSTLHSFHS